MEIAQEYLETIIEKLDKLHDFLGYKLDNLEYALQAITCSGFAQEYTDKTKMTLNNQDSLAVVGDHVIKLTLSNLLFRKNPEINNGELSITINELQSNFALQRIGERLNIYNFLLYVNTELDGKKKLATSLEAIIGAVFLSEGFDEAKKFILKLYGL